MTARREALLGRFRASSLERVRTIERVLFEAGQAATIDLFSPFLGELHTIKGEARMLGLERLSRFVHVFEQCLLEAFQSSSVLGPDALQGALRVLAIVVRTLQGALDTEPTLIHGLSLLEGSGLAAMSTMPLEIEPTNAPVREASTVRWTQVQTTHVDRICEVVEEVTWSIDQLHAELRLLAKEGSDRAVRLLEHAERSRPRLEELKESAWALRLVPVEPVLTDLIRHGREIAEGAGKRVRFQVDAAGTQIERQVLERLRDPLLHLIRNAVDHAIEAPEDRKDKDETASVNLSAHSVGSTVEVSVEDDGRGIDIDGLRDRAVDLGHFDRSSVDQLSDAETIDLLFRPGFSTRREATELSGRGVGLDIVRRKVEEIGGVVHVDSEQGLGTRFLLSLPTTMTRERSVVVETADGVFGLPSRFVQRVEPHGSADEERVAGGCMIRRDGSRLPVRSFEADLMTVTSPSCIESMRLIMSIGQHRWAWTIGRVLGEYDLVRRTLDPLVAASGILAGSAMLEDGRLVLLVRVQEVLRRAEATGTRHTTSSSSARSTSRVLVVDDSPIIRDLISDVLRSAGLEVETATDGEDALERIERRIPDLVVTDLEMPNLDGFGLLASIRRRSQRLPVVVVTTRGSVEDRRRASELGADAYLVKTGFEGAQLLDTVRRFVEVA